MKTIFSALSVFLMSFSLVASADVLESDVNVSGGLVNGIGFAEGIVSNVANNVKSVLEPLPADQCNFTKQCQNIFGDAADDCFRSQSKTSVCMCGGTACTEVFPELFEAAPTGFIACEIRSEEGDVGTTGFCRARVSEGDFAGSELSCIALGEQQVNAIASIGESSRVRFDSFGVFCTDILVGNGSQYGAKVRAVSQ